MRDTYCASLLIGSLLLGSCSGRNPISKNSDTDQSDSASQPNIVNIMAGDLGYSDLGSW